MRCSELEPLVVPFVDGEIADRDRALVDEHLRACSSCRSRVDAEREARDAIYAARAAFRETAPPALRERCAGLCAVRHGARRWLPISLAAAASLLAGLLWFGSTDAGTPVLAAQLTLDHVKCSKFNSSRATGSAMQLAAYWREQYGWPIRVPEGFDDDVHLSGVRRCGSSDGSTAHIMYTHDGRPLSLFIARDSGRASRAIDVFGHEAVVWSSDDRTYVLVGKEPRAEMETLAAMIRKDLRVP
jgi:anti-sigma factor RsiW